MRTSPLLADFIHARGCKPICAKLLTLPQNKKSGVPQLARELCVPTAPRNTKAVKSRRVEIFPQGKYYPSLDGFRFAWNIRRSRIPYSFVPAVAETYFEH